MDDNFPPLPPMANRKSEQPEISLKDELWKMYGQLWDEWKLSCLWILNFELICVNPALLMKINKVIQAYMSKIDYSNFETTI